MQNILNCRVAVLIRGPPSVILQLMNVNGLKHFATDGGQRIEYVLQVFFSLSNYCGFYQPLCIKIIIIFIK